MRLVFYTNIVSPHQLPLARELVAQLGAANYRYVYLFDVGKERSSLGWGGDRPNWCVSATSSEGREWLENADFMLCGYRDVGIMERRAAKGLRTAYTSERWFKPISIGVGQRCRCSVPGVRFYDRAGVSESDLLRSDWDNIWRPGTPCSLSARWNWLKSHPIVGSRIEFLKKLLYAILRRHCYFVALRRWHIKRLYPGVEKV